MRSSSALRLVLASGRRSAARGSAGISRKTPLASGTMRVFRMGGMLSSGLPAASTQMMRSRPWICSNISISRRTQGLSCVSGEQMTISVREAVNASRMLSGSECEAASSSSSRKHLPKMRLFLRCAVERDGSSRAMLCGSRWASIAFCTCWAISASRERCR